MAYPYKKMDEDDFAYIRSVTACDRVWVGDEIAREYYRDEMPEYGVFPPELYVEVINKEEYPGGLPGRRYGAGRRGHLQVRRHHAFRDADEPDFPGGSQEPDHHG